MTTFIEKNSQSRQGVVVTEANKHRNMNAVTPLATKIYDI